MNIINENTREQVTGLATRAKNFSRRSKRLAVVFGLLLFGTLGVFFLTLNMEPSTALTSVGVPEKMFAEEDLFGSRQGQQDSFLTSMFSFLFGSMAFGVIFGAIGLMIGFVAWNDNIKNIGKGMSMLGGVFIFGSLYLDILNLKAEDIFPASNRQHFVSEIKIDDFPSVRQKLKLKGLEDRPVGLYLLAQMSLVEGKNQMDITDDVIGGILSPAAGFTPNSKVLYAIEHAAYGRPKSEASIAYRDKLLSWQRWIQWVAMILGGATIVTGFFLAGVTWLRHAIVGRVRRIENLCGQPVWSAA